MKDENMDWDTADVKACEHGYVFVKECMACNGIGELPVPKTYMTCPCCKGREKTRACRKCSGKGYT